MEKLNLEGFKALTSQTKQKELEKLTGGIIGRPKFKAEKMIYLSIKL